MNTLYLSAGQTRFQFDGTNTIPISTFSDKIKVIREQRTGSGPGLYLSFFPELAHLIPQHFYYLTPGKNYIISALSSFQIDYI